MPQLAHVVSIGCKLYSLNLSFAQLNLSNFCTVLCFSEEYSSLAFHGSQLKEENGYIPLPKM